MKRSNTRVVATLPQAGAPAKRKKPSLNFNAKEFCVMALRECHLPDDMPLCDNPDYIADYWRVNIASIPHFDPMRECLVALLLNTRRRTMGHHLVSIGSVDTILAPVLSVFRAAVIAAASAIVVIHNHPSGDASPSEADIKVTRELIQAGKHLSVELLDHVIMGQPMKGCPLGYRSLRELGYFYS